MRKNGIVFQQAGHRYVKKHEPGPAMFCFGFVKSGVRYVRIPGQFSAFWCMVKFSRRYPTDKERVGPYPGVQRDQFVTDPYAL